MVNYSIHIMLICIVLFCRETQIWRVSYLWRNSDETRSYFAGLYIVVEDRQFLS